MERIEEDGSFKLKIYALRDYFSIFRYSAGVKPQLEGLLRDYVVILDCTSATKPATIAYYELAQTYLTPLIYVYEETGQLKWLVDREGLESQLGLNIPGGRPRERKHR